MLLKCDCGLGFALGLFVAVVVWFWLPIVWGVVEEFVEWWRCGEGNKLSY